MGWLQDLWKSPASWIVPGKGVWDIGKWLMGGGRGDKAQPPDIGAPQYQMDMEWIKDWMEKGETGIRGETTRWLENAMRGYRKESSGRGWTPATTGAYAGFGDRASGVAAERMASSLADLYGQGARMEHLGKMQGMQMYGTDYQTWLQGQQQGTDQWINSIMSIVGLFI